VNPSRSEADDRVIEHMSRSASAASALTIAKVALGPRARKHSVDSLNMVGLAIAARLCGQQIIKPTKTNQFILNRLTGREAAGHRKAILIRAPWSRVGYNRDGDRIGPSGDPWLTSRQIFRV
jgi:hypothetical protein